MSVFKLLHCMTFFTQSINFYVQKSNPVISVLEDMGRGKGRREGKAKPETDEDKGNIPLEDPLSFPPNPYGGEPTAEERPLPRA